MGWFSSNPSLKGRYKGKRDENLSFHFEFRSDGTYSYRAYQEGREWRLVHHGKYKLMHFQAASRAQYPRHEIIFRPSEFEEMPPPLYIRLLESRDLPTERAVEYEVTWPTRPDDPYILFVPKGKEHAERDSWMIRPEGVAVQGGYFGAR